MHAIPSAWPVYSLFPQTPLIQAFGGGLFPEKKNSLKTTSHPSWCILQWHGAVSQEHLSPSARPGSAQDTAINRSSGSRRRASSRPLMPWILASLNASATGCSQIIVTLSTALGTDRLPGLEPGVCLRHPTATLGSHLLSLSSHSATAPKLSSLAAKSRTMWTMREYLEHFGRWF